MQSVITNIAVLTYVAFSMLYVYRFRGSQRFESFNQYLRKGWPVFTPMNVALYALTKKEARSPFTDADKIAGLKGLTDNWDVIRDEALSLQRDGVFEATVSKENSSHYDVGFRTFYKYGWSKFYLKWYGTTHRSALRLCPKTSELIRAVPSVNGAMFSVLKPGGKLTPHLDPLACSLRCHIGLDTPNSDHCFISVDGIKHSWRDGEAFVFDETYIHFVENDTDQPRLILMLDLERPLSLPGRLLNWPIKQILAAFLTPNTTEDRVGLFSKAFRSATPLLACGAQLKQTNPKAYRFAKYSINGLLLLIPMAAIALIASIFAE